MDSFVTYYLSSLFLIAASIDKDKPVDIINVLTTAYRIAFDTSNTILYALLFGPPG